MTLVSSTTIDLCLSVFWWAEFRKAKGGIKMHTLYDFKTRIPSFVYIIKICSNKRYSLFEKRSRQTYSINHFKPVGYQFGHGAADCSPAFKRLPDFPSEGIVDAFVFKQLQNFKGT